MVTIESECWTSEDIAQSEELFLLESRAGDFDALSIEEVLKAVVTLDLYVTGHRDL